MTYYEPLGINHGIQQKPAIPTRSLYSISISQLAYIPPQLQAPAGFEFSLWQFPL